MSTSAFERFKNSKWIPGSSQGGTGDDSLTEEPGTPSVSGSDAHTVLAVAPQPTKILQDVIDCVQTLKASFDDDGNPVDDNNQTLHRFCAKLEFLLQADMKDKKTITGKKKDYWEYFCDCLSPLKGVNDGIKYVKTTGDCKTSLGKGRAFLRFCLMHHRLADSLQACCTNGKATSGWFYQKSIWLQHDKSNMVISELYDLNDIIFDLAPRGYDLDNSWPSFARKSNESQHTWSLSERARTMSISSINSIGQDTPTKGQFSSTPNDTPVTDHLAQELAVSENVRSELEDKMEALQQQKSVFQQNVAESRGEVNMLENQIRELQIEHKQLLATHREMEKKYDKMCVETEFKERDGKTQESVFETKLSELKTENDKLLHKITQMQEDLDLAQENLQITATERNSTQKIVDELIGRVSEFEGRAKETEEIAEEKACEIEAEKIELLQKLKTVEESEGARQRSLSDAHSELRDQTSLVVSLERKVSALTTGYQWLNKLRDGTVFTEIPDLDATSSLTLKDVSYFISGLHEKICSVSHEKETVNEQYQTLSAKNTELQQEKMIDCAKMLNLETSLIKLQENEEHLKQQVKESVTLAEHVTDQMNKVKDDVGGKENDVTELKSSLASLEQDRSQIAKELELKDGDVQAFKKEIERYKEELNRTNEMARVAVKNAQESLEKVRPLELVVKEKDAKIGDLLLKEKECELQIRSMEKQDVLQCARFSDKEKEIEHFGNELKKQVQINESLKDKFDVIKSEKDSVSMELKISKDKLNDFKNKITQLEEKVTEKKQNIDSLNREVELHKSVAQNKQTEFGTEKDTLIRELDSAKTSKAHYERDVTNLKEKQNNLESTITKLHEYENRITSKLEIVEKELSSKSLSLLSIEKDYDITLKQNAHLEDENTELKSNIKSLQDVYYEKQSEVMLLQEKNQRGQDEFERTKQFYETAAKTESEWSDRFRTLDSNLIAKDSKIAELTEVEKSLTVENSKLSRDKADLEHTLEKLESDMEYLKKGFKGKESQIEELRVLIGESNVEKERLRRSLDDLTTQLEEKMSEVGSLQQEVENGSIERNTLDQSIKELNIKESNTDKVNRKFEQALFDIEQKKKELTQTIVQMQNDFEVTVQDKDILEDKVSTLEQESKTNKKQIEDWNNDIFNIQKDKEVMHVISLEKDEQLNQERERFQKLQLDMEVLSKDKYELEESVDSLEREVQEDTKEIEELRIAIGNLEGYERVFEEKIRQLEITDMNNKNQIDSLVSMKTELEKDNDILKKQLSSEINEKNKLEAAKEHLQCELDTSEKSINEKVLEIKSMSAKLEEQNESIDMLENGKADIEINFQKITDDVFVLQEKELNNVDSIRKLEEHIRKNELEKESIQGNLSLKCVEINELQARFDDFQSENACLVQEYDLLQQTFNDLKETEEVVRSKFTEMTACRDEISAKLEQVIEQLRASEKQLQELVDDKDSLLQEKEAMCNELITYRRMCSDSETRQIELENTITGTCLVKDQLAVQLQDKVGEIEKKNVETENLKKYIIEIKDSLSNRQNEVELLEKKLTDLEDECKANEERERTLYSGLSDKEIETLKLQEMVASQECNLSESWRNICQLEENEITLKNDLEESRQISDNLELIVNTKTEAIRGIEEKAKDLTEVVEQLVADKKQMVLDLKCQQQERDTLQNKASGNLDIIANLKREIHEIKRQKLEDISELDNEVDKLRETETKLSEAKVVTNDEVHRLHTKVEFLETTSNDTKLANAKLQEELEELCKVKNNLTAKCLGFEKMIHELKLNVKQIEHNREICETDLRQTTSELETKKDTLVKHLEDAVKDLQVIKVQLNNTSAELESSHEEKLCLEKSLDESNAKNEHLELQVNSLNDQIQSNVEHFESQLNERESRIEELESIKVLLETETETKVHQLQQGKADIEEILQQCSNELELLKISVKEKQELIKTSESKIQQTCIEMEDLNRENETLDSEISEIKEQIKQRDELIGSTTGMIDQVKDEKTALSEQLQSVVTANAENDKAMSELNEQIHILTDHIEHLKEENYDFKDEQQHFLDKEMDLIAHLTESDYKNTVLQEQYANLQEENKLIKSCTDQESDELRNMEEKLQENKNILESLESENEQNALDSEAEVASLRQEIITLEFQLSSNQLEVEQNQKSGMEETEFSDMKDKLMEQETIIEQLQREMLELREVANKYREQELTMDSLHAEINNKESEHCIIAEQLENLQKELRQEMDSSVNVKHTLDDEKVKSEELIQDKDGEISQLKEDTSALKKKLVKLIREKDSLWQKTDRLSFQQKLQASEKWMDDSKVTHCLGCNAEFSFTLRKHHCRLCGRIFCHNCSSNWVDTASSSKKSRACTDCYVHYNTVLLEDNNMNNNSDIEYSVEIPPTHVLRAPLPSSNSITASIISSAPSSDADSVLTSGTSENVSRKLVYDVDDGNDVPSDMGEQLGATEDNDVPSDMGAELGATGGNDVPSDMCAQLGATGDNETDEDKLKDSTGVLKSDEKGDGVEDRFHVISDEEIQRSLSISMSDDQEPPAQLQPNMSSSLCVSLSELMRGEVNSHNEVWIKAGRSFAVPVRIDRSSTVFGWEFTSYPKDVVFSVNYRSSQSVVFSDGQTLVPPCKCDSHKQVVKGELTAKQLGVYTLLFDNTYSKLTSKRINYTLLSDPPQTD